MCFGGFRGFLSGFRRFQEASKSVFTRFKTSQWFWGLQGLFGGFQLLWREGFQGVSRRFASGTQSMKRMFGRCSCRVILGEKYVACAVVAAWNPTERVRLQTWAEKQPHLFWEKKTALWGSGLRQIETGCAVLNKHVPCTASRNRRGGILMVDQREMIERLKYHFDEHLNGAENVATGGLWPWVNDYIRPSCRGREWSNSHAKWS